MASTTTGNTGDQANATPKRRDIENEESIVGPTLEGERVDYVLPKVFDQQVFIILEFCFIIIII